MSLMDNFLFLYLRQSLHASNTLLSLSVVMQVLPEFPILLCAPFLIIRLKPVRMMLIANTAVIVRSGIEKHANIQITPRHITVNILYIPGVYHDTYKIPAAISPKLAD